MSQTTQLLTEEAVLEKELSLMKNPRTQAEHDKRLALQDKLYDVQQKLEELSIKSTNITRSINAFNTY